MLLAAGAAGATNLVDVRVGVHKAFTRVVLETDAAAKYSVSQKPHEVAVHVAATSRARRISAKSVHVIWVQVEPAPGGASDVRIQLRGPARLKQLVLHKPERLVLDLYTAVQKAAVPAPAAKPPPVAPAVPSPATEPTASAASAVPSAVAAGTAASPSGTSTAAGTASAGTSAASTPGTTSREEPLTVEVLRPQPAAQAQAGRPEAPRPALRPAPPRRAAPPATGPLDFLPSPLNQPTTLGLVAFLFVVLFLWMRMRRRHLEAEDSDLSPFDRPDEAGEEAASEAAAEPEAFGEAEVEVEAEVADAVFPAPDEDPPVAAAVSEAVPSLEVPLSGSPVSAPAASGAAAGELERRLAHLETRLEELVDARERLERQVAAQTEELRVQRAAIARTQRVVRSISANPEDEASEPAPKL